MLRIWVLSFNGEMAWKCAWLWRMTLTGKVLRKGFAGCGQAGGEGGWRGHVGRGGV